MSVVETAGKKHNLEQDVADPNKKQKKEHKTYNDYQKELIVQANLQGGRDFRLKVASLIGMPAATADHVIHMYKKQGKEALHDHRHDHRIYLGKGHTKKDSELLKLVLEWLHMDAKLTHAQIRELINLEIFRRILKDQKLPLGDDEKECNSPITSEHIEKYFSLDKVKEEYKANHIESEATIGHWLQNVIISRKHILDDSNLVNSDENQNVRLLFAKDLLKAMEDDNAILVFIDELPLWLNMHHPPGKASTDIIHEHCHCFMAAQPSLGLIRTEIFTTESPPEQKHGLQHNATQWKKFVNELCESLLGKLDKIKGKDIYIIADVPMAYIDSVAKHKSICKTVPFWDKLQSELQKSDKDLYLIKQSSNSPPLNLGEFYNTQLKSKANALLHDLIVNEKEEKNQEFLHKNEAHHQLLAKIALKVLKEMEEQPPHSSFVTRLTESIQDVIAADGKMDFGKAYAHLFK